jgi:D-alanine-D-alanine ligase
MKIDHAHPLRVAVLFNLKKNAPHDGLLPPDAWADLDSEVTVDAIASALRQAGHQVILLEGNPDAFETLRRERPDIAYNICEGHRGDAREAQIPAMLEMLGIPYTASRVLAQALSLDKAMCKRLFSFHGLPTPPFQVFERSDEALAPDLTFPLFVKPGWEGTGMGVTPRSIVHDEASLREQVQYVIGTYQQGALVEQYLGGREFTVAVMGNGKLTTFPPMEVDLSECPPEERGLYTARIKSELGELPRYLCPAPISDALSEEMQEAAIGAFRAIGAADIARVDFRMDDAGRPYILEINALPGVNPVLSDLCIYTNMLGIPYDWLINRILDLACVRWGLPTSDAFDQPMPYDPPRPGEMRVARVGEPDRTVTRPAVE